MVAASTSNALTNSPIAEPAANSLKHGMTATRFVPPEQEDRRRAIRSQLEAVYRPTSREEIHCVDELALAEAQLYDVEAAAWRRFEWEKAHARERFDRRMREQLEKDLAAWRAEPYFGLDILALTWQGVCHLARVWAEIAEILADSESACPLERIFDAIASQKSRFDVDNVCFEGAWIIKRHLAIVPDPQAEIDRWFDLTIGNHEKPRNDQRIRARRFLNNAPDPATARRELLAKATTERDRWAMRANDLRSRYETDRELAADRAVGFVPSDEMATRESRLALRYLTTARNRVEKIQRRLDALLKFRPVNSLRQRNTSLELPSLTSPMTGAETARILAEIEEMEAGNRALDAENAAIEARTAAMEAEIAAWEAEEAAEDAAESQSEPGEPNTDAVITENPRPATPRQPAATESLDSSRRPRRPDPRKIRDKLLAKTREKHA